MSKPFLRTLPLVAAVLVLSACQSTVVERMPEGTVAECPAEWRGAFIALGRNVHLTPDFVILLNQFRNRVSADWGVQRSTA